MTKTEVLRGARSIIETRGLCQDGTYGRKNSPRCFMGAVFESTPSWVIRGQVEADIERKLGLPVTEWNDPPTTTKADVMTLFDVLIAEAQQQEVA